MSSEEYLKPHEVCRILGISYITLWRWIREGKVKAVRSPSGRYLIPRSEIEKIKGKTESSQEQRKIRAVIYARVSSSKQKEQGDLDRVPLPLWGHWVIFLTHPFGRPCGLIRHRGGSPPTQAAGLSLNYSD